MNRLRVLCISIIITGILMFLSSYFLIPFTSPVFGWCIGLASGLIILGLGSLVNVLYGLYSATAKKQPPVSGEPYASVREKSGYLVCKIMNVLLCIHLLLLYKLDFPPTVILLGILLVIVQYLLDLFIQLFLLSRAKSSPLPGGLKKGDPAAP